MSRVVITGMGAITPIGNNIEEFWQNMKKGICGVGPITKFDASDLRASVAAEVKDFSYAGVLDKLTANKMDLFVQYAVCAAEEAVKDSQIQDQVDPDMFGVYVSSGVGGIITICESEDARYSKGNKFVSPQFVPKMIINMAAGQIAIRYGAHGNAMSLATACATGSTSIGEAYRAIKDGYLTAAIAGGSEAAVQPLAAAGFVNCMALTTQEDPNQACVPFDKRRRGFVLGEGAGIMILEEYEHAKARGAHIYGEIVGYGATCDAHHVTAPDPEGTQTARAMRMALQDVAYDSDKLYINAHGTGTKMNDVTETKAIKLALGEDAYKAHVSSTKSMTGHMLGAAGAIEAIASVLALQDSIIPPTIHLEDPDPECDLDYTPNVAKEYPIQVALSNSLGFGGHNACLAFKKVTP